MKTGTSHKGFRSAEMEPMRYWDVPVNEELPAAAAAAASHSCLDHERCWWKTLLAMSLTCMEFTGSSQKQESSQAHGRLVCKRCKVTFLWIKVGGKVLQSCMCVILTVGEVISLEVLFSTLKVFICEPCDLERSLAKELIMDVTRWQLFLESSQNHHYQNWEVLFWQRNNLYVQWLSA